MQEQFKQYRISEALMTVYRLFWDEFSAWYLEMIKPAYIDGKAQPIDQITYNSTLQFFETLMKMLHPFMPFITEELWQHIADRKNGESIMSATLTIDNPSESDHKLVDAIENMKQVVENIKKEQWAIFILKT